MTCSESAVLKIAVISDTHGLLRESVLAVLDDVDYIIHAGDVNNAYTLQQIRDIAPSYVVRGNTDNGPAVSALPSSDCFTIGHLFFYVIHDLSQIDIDPFGAGIDVVVSGHTHQPVCEQRDSVLFLNPGSVGPRRFDYPISLAVISIGGGSYDVQTIEFDE